MTSFRERGCLQRGVVSSLFLVSYRSPFILPFLTQTVKLAFRRGTRQGPSFSEDTVATGGTLLLTGSTAAARTWVRDQGLPMQKTLIFNHRGRRDPLSFAVPACDRCKSGNLPALTSSSTCSVWALTKAHFQIELFRVFSAVAALAPLVFVSEQAGTKLLPFRQPEIV